MEIGQMRYFVAACEYLNFSAAAESCYTSRQNITRSVRSLEGELGVVLFMRERNGMRLTVEGEEAFRRVQMILREIDGLAGAFRERSTEGEVLEVLFAAGFLANAPDLITDAVYSYDASPLRISECDYRTCCTYAAQGKVDVSVVFGLQRDAPECEAVLLHKAPLYALVNAESKVALKNSFELRDLIDRRVLLLSNDGMQYRQLLEAYEDFGFDKNAIDIIMDAKTMVHMVRKEDVVGIAFGEFSPSKIEGVRLLPFANKRLRWRVYALYKPTSGAKGLAARSFVGHLSSAFEDYDKAITA